MSSTRQAAANQKNAAKSTGPTTDAGKARSRENAFKHGLTGEGVVSSNALDQAIEDRLALWYPHLTNDWDARQAVLATIRVDRCQSEENVRRSELTAIANDPGAEWDRCRQLEAIELGARLARQPETISARLKTTREGRAWLAEKWKGLIEVAPREMRGLWNEAQMALAFDLLGITTELRKTSAIMNTFHTPVQAKAFAEAQIEALAKLDVENTTYDALRREQAKQGLGLDEDVVLRRLRRYEAAALRTYRQALSTLMTQVAPATESTPEPKPTEPTTEATPAPPPVVEPVITVRADVAHEVPVGNRRHRKAMEKLLRVREKTTKI